MVRLHRIVMILCVMLVAVLPACSSSQQVEFASLDEIKSTAVNDKFKSYKIGVGDELEIKFFSSPELNERVTVAPDGTLSMMFVPYVQASGLSVRQLAQEIKTLLRPHMKHVDLAVVVRNFGSQKLYIMGEVSKPGAVQLKGAETFMQVLGEAGWITPEADSERLILLRRDKSGQERVYAINLDAIIEARDLSQNVMVQAGDIILAPPSDVVVADRWINQYIRQMLPLSSSAGVAYNLNPAGK